MAREAPSPGRRICVIGTSGSGKTYVAQAIAEKPSISFVSNDSIIWRANWQPTPDDERLRAIEAAMVEPEWTFDGNLSLWRPEDRLVLERCDTVVWLDLPRWQVWSQVAWRTATRYVKREVLWHGNRESLRMAFSRNSIIWWSIRTYSSRRKAYRELFEDPVHAGKTLVRLGSRREVDQWLRCVASGSELTRPD